MRRRVTITALFVSILSAGTAIAVKHAQQNAPHTRRISLSSAAVVSRSAPLSRLIDPETASLSVEPYASNPDNPRFWYVMCDDAAGNERLRMDWDARSGALIQVSAVGEMLKPNGMPLLSRDTARHAAHRWLTEIAPRPGSDWHVDQVFLGYNKFVWHAFASSGPMRGHIAIEARTGKLLMLQAYRPHLTLPWQPANTMQTELQS
jgi:hypothetical protein